LGCELEKWRWRKGGDIVRKEGGSKMRCESTQTIFVLRDSRLFRGTPAGM